MDNGFDDNGLTALASDGSHLIDICRRNRLRVIDTLPSRVGASVAVMCVLNSNGERLVLKETASVVGSGEIAVLRAANASGITPRFRKEVERGVYLAEWLPGRSLADTPPGEPVDAAAIGGALRTLHQVEPPAGLRSIKNGFFHRRAAGWRALPPTMRRRGDELSAVLDTRVPHVPMLLHGDVVPTNVIITREGPRLIDPIGLRGLGAWDLAQLAVTAAGRGRLGIFSAMVSGYGAELAYLSEMVAWMTLHYLDKNLAVPDSPFTPQLQPLAEAAVAVSNAGGILERYLR